MVLPGNCFHCCGGCSVTCFSFPSSHSERSLMSLLLCNCLREADESRVLSNGIDKEITQWMKLYNRSIKLLLLGAGESGKTTIIKQMKILHVQGFSDDERREKAREIRKNILESIRDITSHMFRLEPRIELEKEENQRFVQIVLNFSPDVTEVSEEMFDAVEYLWSDAGVQESYRRSNEYPLIDCAKYFLDRITDVRRADYLPSDQDILRSRKTTTDIQKIEFSVRIAAKYGGGHLTFWMFDVGGQRGERRKWIQVFDGISAILFLCASSGFNTKIREDNETNRLKESLRLFEEVWTSRFLQDAGFILFLNKQDILKEKIQRGARIQDFFPEYLDYVPASRDEDSGDEYIRVRCFIRDKFRSITKKRQERNSGVRIDDTVCRGHSHRQLFCHFTTATDTDNIKRVFDDVHTMIIMNNLKKFSIA